MQTLTAAEPMVAHVREVFLLAVAKHNGLTPQRDDLAGEWVLSRFGGEVVYRAVVGSSEDDDPDPDPTSPTDLQARRAKLVRPITEAVVA